MNRIKFKTSLFRFALFANLVFVSFVDAGDKNENNTGIKGTFVNSTFLGKITESAPGNIPFYCTEMNFISANRVKISNGFEDYELGYQKEGNNWLLLKASFKGDMLFTLNRDSSITLADSVWTDNPSNSEFKKITVKSLKIKAFDYCLNQHMIAGEYILYQNNKPSAKKVVFGADGDVTGLGQYTTYSICFSGDCIGETRLPSNIICFKNKKNGITDCAFKVDKKNKTLEIYKLTAPQKDIIGEREIMNKIFDLRQ